MSEMTTTKTRRLPMTSHGNAYNIFILVLTLMSLVIMALLLLPIDEATDQLLRVYDNLICVVFLVDFTINLRASRPASRYFIRERGWLDLLGSIPSLGGAFRLAALFRLARISRLLRIFRLLAAERGNRSRRRCAPKQGPVRGFYHRAARAVGTEHLERRDDPGGEPIA